jgi:hypothetical protein
MRAFIFSLVLICLLQVSASDSLIVTHYAVDIKILAYEDRLLVIRDQELNTLFQGIYNADQGFWETLVMPAGTESLYVSLGDSLKILAVNDQTASLLADFRPPSPDWVQKLAWFKNDLIKAIPILIFFSFFIILKQRDRLKKEKE